MEERLRKCAFCGSENPPYTCPRCQQPYCKLLCYQDADHQSCSEPFYKEWVKSCLSGTGTRGESKSKMLEILKKLHSEVEQDCGLDSDDDGQDDDDKAADDKGIEDLNAKLLSRLEICGPDELWNNLSPSDQEAVKSLLDTQEICLWNPWWYYEEPAKKLVSEIDAPKEKVSSPVPRVPDNIPRLHTLTSRKPSDSIQYQVLNIVAAYTFVARYFNGDHVEDAKASVQVLFQQSQALNNTLQVTSAVESVYQIRSTSGQDVSIDDRTLQLVFDDLCQILKGPKYDTDCHYVCAALSDVLDILRNAKEQSECKKKIKLAIKRIEYLISWHQDYGCKILKNNIPSLQIEIASLTENISSLEKAKESLLVKNEVMKVVEI